MHETSKNHTVCLHDSIGEFMEQCKSETSNGGGSSSLKAGDEWSFHTDLRGATELAVAGWDSRPEDLQSIAQTLQAGASGEIQRQTTCAAVEGAFVDVGAYLGGEPECMVQFTTEAVKEVVKIGFNISTGSGADETTFKLRGAIILALTEALSGAGYPVEITVYRACKNRDHSCLEGFTLKASESYLDLDALAFFCAHPAALRKLWFAHAESLPSENGAAAEFGASGYGSPSSLQRLSAKAQKALPLDVNIDCAPHNEAAAVKYFNKVLRSLSDKGLIAMD